MRPQRQSLERCGRELRTADGCRKLEEAGKTLTQSLQRERDSPVTWNLGFWPPELRKYIFVGF